MSLWTPDGEIPVDRPRQAAPEPEPSGDMLADGLAGIEGIDIDQLTPEQRAELEQAMAQMAAVQQQIAETPAAAVIANHAMGLYELAAIKLQTQPIQLADAKLAIDCLAAVVDIVGDGFGPDTPTLRQALSQLQMAYVEIAERGNDA